MNLKKTQLKIYCIGIGGSGLSGLAAILAKSGHKIFGSDQLPSKFTKELEELGIIVNFTQKEENIDETYDLIIHSHAIENDHEELKKAHRLNLKVVNYPEALGLLTKSYETIAVCGTHGKTTVTSMMASVAIGAGLDPTVIIGAVTKELNGHNYRSGKGNLLIIEACEYRRSFLNYHHDHIIITNIELDHLDYFKDEKDYFSSYMEFCLKTKQNGSITYQDVDKMRDFIAKLKIERPDLNFNKFQDLKESKYILKIPGLHNQNNADAVSRFAQHVLNVPSKIINERLQSFEGASRRFEFKGNFQGIPVIDDYAHHPTEIRATLNAARQKFGSSAHLTAVFQPHQFSRTYHLIKEFSDCFTDADELLITDILNVRDSKYDEQKITTEDFVTTINHNNKHATGNLEQTLQFLLKKNLKTEALIIMGAGSIGTLSDQLTKN
ncbi:UDP-N-acetylmuramate--L-alanine ligase [Candidatus Peregrinibacteria bacterium]|nr:UDP-N-acetylmuramate--L-alanine ligase [Candidatus Peregrinibacteria bacterium]